MRLVSLGCKRFCEAGRMIRYTSRTVPYVEQLTSVYICYSQGNGSNTPLSIFYIPYCTRKSVPLLLLLLFVRLWSIAYQFPTSGSGNKYYLVCVCVYSTYITKDKSPAPSRPSRARPVELRGLSTDYTMPGKGLLSQS